MKPVSLWNTKQSRLIRIAKAWMPPTLWALLYRRLIVGAIPDADRYKPFYGPWWEPDFDRTYRVISDRTLCSRESCWTLDACLRQTAGIAGAVYEAGVFQGGTARLIRDRLAGSGKTLRLFDSFAGMKQTDQERDRHRSGDFAATSLAGVSRFVGADPWIDYRPGWIPDSFAGCEDDAISFAHVDVDLHQSILDCCGFIYPRLAAGAMMVFDDYGFASCPGARQAIDDFFRDKPEVPLVLQTGQALVVKR
jgi:O-methyltransferase